MQNADLFEMRIADDGVGFAIDGATTGHGLASQRQRAQALGGELRIESKPGEGTAVTLRAKLSSSSQPAHT
jgi:signal transduction histidine kinase